MCLARNFFLTPRLCKEVPFLFVPVFFDFPDPIFSSKLNYLPFSALLISKLMFWRFYLYALKLLRHEHFRTGSQKSGGEFGAFFARKFALSDLGCQT
jgi:hypothetical protein